VPIRDFTASSYVAAQCKNIRRRRGWSQQRLADRLSELLEGPPPEMFEDDDPRRRGAKIRKSLPSKWTQSRIAKLERGALKCVSVDDVLELSLGLDVSPLVLMTPALEPQGEDDRAESWSSLRPGQDDTFRVWLGGSIARWPHEVRQWIRGVNPLLRAGDYKTDDEARKGRLFYLVESQPLGEVRLIEEAGAYAERMRAMRALLTPTDEETEE
jgi:transcriptional regulator with XRE-family HTH domain